MSENQFFRRDAASDYLKATFAIQAAPSYLAKMAVNGGGPEFHKAGRWPIYSRDALDRWAMSRLGKLVATTAEYGKAA